MIVELISHTFPDDPSWIVVSQDVPLGTKYEVIGYDRDFTIVDIVTSKKRDIDAYFLLGNGGAGWMPTVCFRPVKEERKES